MTSADGAIVVSEGNECFSGALLRRDEDELIQTLREIPEGPLRLARMHVLQELAEPVRCPCCRDAQADGVPCVSAETSCENCQYAIEIPPSLAPAASFGSVGPSSRHSIREAMAAPAAGHVPASPGSGIPWQARFAQRMSRVTSSAIRDLLKLTERPDLISFAGGLPAPELFPTAEVAAAAQRILEEHGAVALQYGATEGYRPFRELLVRHMARYGISVTPNNVLVTSGAQQALDLVGKLFLDPGDRVLTEVPTYLGAIQAFGAYQARFVTVPIDDDGLRIDAVEPALRSRPKFLYVLPNFQNPGGVTLALERRRRLVELASRHATPIVEDDPYGQLRYEGQHLPPLLKLDAELHGSTSGEARLGGVLYLGTLSKILAPGLRIGWVVGPEPVIQRLLQLKQAADLHTSTFTQMLAYEVARGGFLDRHVRALRRTYGQRRDAMLAALERHLPARVRWTRPHGGLFLWVELPAGCDSAALLREALEQQVAFVPGASFFPDGGGAETLRLNFSYSTPARIEEGIARLGAVLRRTLA